MRKGSDLEKRTLRGMLKTRGKIKLGAHHRGHKEECEKKRLGVPPIGKRRGERGG